MSLLPRFPSRQLLLAIALFLLAWIQASPAQAQHHYTVDVKVDLPMLARFQLLNVNGPWHPYVFISQVVRVWAAGIPERPVAEGSASHQGQLQLSGSFYSWDPAASLSVQVLHYGDTTHGTGRQYLGASQVLAATLPPSESERQEAMMFSGSERVVKSYIYQVKGEHSFQVHDGRQVTTTTVSTREEVDAVIRSWQAAGVSVKIRRNW
jgi:hypothetical protein